MKKSYSVLPRKPTDEQTKELENYGIDEFMAKTIMLTYIEDVMIRFFENYKTMKEMFEANKVRYDVNTTTHMQLLFQ